MYMHYLGLFPPPPAPLFSSFLVIIVLKKNTPVQRKDGVGLPVVPGGPGHRHQDVAEEVTEKRPRVTRIENFNKS